MDRTNIWFRDLKRGFKKMGAWYFAQLFRAKDPQLEARNKDVFADEKKLS